MLPLNSVAHQTKSTSRPILFSISKYQLTSMNNYEQDRWGLVPSTWWMTLLLSKCSQNGLTNCILEPPNITYLQPSIRSKPVVFQIPPRCLFNIRSTGKPYSSYPVMMFTAKPSGLRPGTYAVVSTTKATRRPFWHWGCPRGLWHASPAVVRQDCSLCNVPGFLLLRFILSRSFCTDPDGPYNPLLYSVTCTPCPTNHPWVGGGRKSIFPALV